MNISVSGVSERDLDLLLLEEFVASSHFRQWFAEQVAGPSIRVTGLIDASHSVTQTLGESDLEITVSTQAGDFQKFLIENKIDAAFQPSQAERYRQRGKAYLQQGECQAFSTVLIAPQGYFGFDVEPMGFDTAITYETMRDWFQQSELPVGRREYKTYLLAGAIEKSLLGYQMEADAKTTDFWTYYWQVAGEYAPELQMTEPGGKPAQAGFAYFRQGLLPTGVQLIHKFGQARVDLQFFSMGRHLQQMHQVFGEYLSDEMHIVRASESAVIRIEVPKLNTAAPFDEQLDVVKKGLDAASRLAKWFVEFEHLWHNREQR